MPDTPLEEYGRNGSLIEAVGTDPSKGRYRVRVIRAGLSGNNTLYPDNVLRAAAPLFNGAQVFVKDDREHLAGQGRTFGKLIGRIEKPVFIEGKKPDSGEIQGELQLIEPDDAVGRKIREAVERGMADLFGLSIDAIGSVKNGAIGGKPARVAAFITKVKSVDLIVDPAAGGQVLNLIESQGDDTMATHNLSQVIIDALIDKARVPPAVKTLLKKQHPATANVGETDLSTTIRLAESVAAATTETGHVRMGDFPRVEPGESQAEKAAAMLDAFLDNTHKDHKHARSLRECYRAITGDKLVTGRLEDCDQNLMRETLLGGTALRESLDSASWGNALGNSIARRMIQLYRLDDIHSIWRRFARPNNATDFRTQERWRVGGYNNLPAVNQGAAYLPMASPTDEKATYAVTKRGGTEDVTLEMIKNDDVRAIQQIPVNLALAANRTLSEFAFDFVRTNPAIYDAVAWFHATHNNLSSSALDATAFAAARLLMMKQTEKDSGKRLGIPPAVLLVPLDLQETAFNLFQRATENDKKFIATITPDIVPVWYWTDTNDWALFANPEVAPALEIGFLDGKEEPELFIQDNPTVGSMFSNDKLTYKIRHIYGGAIVDFRPAVKSVVA